jgi:hypothetical protein
MGSNQSTRGVDYIRSNLFRGTDMKPLVHTQSGPDNDLFEKVEDLVQRAISANGIVYAYGDKWGPEPAKPDQYFGFGPGNGVHKIHMNQGDRENANAKYQDGALFVELPSGKTSGLFMKFQNQAWHTDETHGNPLVEAPNALPLKPALLGPIEPWDVVPSDSPYHLARIIGALVNPQDSGEKNPTVTIFNTSSSAINLAGWTLCDAQDRQERLAGVVRPAHALAGPHHHGVVDLALVDLAAGDRILDADLDDVANPRVAAVRAAQHLDAHQPAGATVVGDFQHRLHLNHGSTFRSRRVENTGGSNRPDSLVAVIARARPPRPASRPWSWTGADTA